ncbi:capsule biosynthesis GfcC family protein [Vibrio renipiscarius]|nr:capsule biosynthesis GfcC family protein [Vibrio renipiscarius]
MMNFRRMNYDKKDRLCNSALSLVLLGLFMSPPSQADTLSVTLPAVQTTLSYEHPVRLDRVFTDAIAQSGGVSPAQYFVANKLFNLDKAEQINQLKQQVLEQLNALALERSKFKTSSELLARQIESWNVAYRENLNLDFDVIRTQPTANPMLSGHFALVAENRSSLVNIEGLVFQPQPLNFSSNLTLRDYINQVDIFSSAHPSYAWVIYPDGHTIRVGYAQWNEEIIQLTPNSVIFLGFDSDSDHTLKLEEQIVKLITMRTNIK